MESRINIVLDNGSRRFIYVCEVLFRHILNVPYRFVLTSAIEVEGSKQSIDEGDIVINYSSSRKYKGITIPNCGLLDELDIRNDFQDIDYLNQTPVLFKQDGDYDIPFDLFSSAFYLLTEYEFAIKGQFDLHGRYDEQKYPIFKKNLHAKALVHEYAEILWQKISKQKSSVARVPLLFDYHVTIDVDHPWAFKYKGIKSILGSLTDILRLDFRNLSLRWGSLFGAKDPYDTYEEIVGLVPKEKLKFFFLINREHKLDGRYTYRNTHYQKLIKTIDSQSQEVGIHPSYTSFLSKQAIAIEKNELEDVLGKKTDAVRQHYLKYRTPATRSYYVQIGLKHDYNSCMINGVGFRNGMGIPFPWFDLQSNVMTKLMIHPLMVMDVSLKDYMGLSPEDALHKIKEIIAECKKHNMEFTLLWHNSSLSEVHGWEGWKRVFEETVSLLKEKSD